jgi:hypothetical protein
VSLADIIRGAVAQAAVLTAALRVEVGHIAWTGQDAFGTASYAAPVARLALVDQTQQTRTSSSGETVLTSASLVFLEPIEANGAPGRQEPVDPRDQFVLPDGTTAEVVGTDGLVDPATGAPYQQTVWLGLGGVLRGGG